MRAFTHSPPFYDSFAELASGVRQAAESLHRIIVEPAEAAAQLEQLGALDQQASDLRVKVVGQIPDALVTPLPREHVHHVASLLGDTVHVLHAAGQRTQSLALSGIQPAAARLAEVLVQAGRCIEASVAAFRRRDYPTARCQDMERLSHEGAAIWAGAVEALFEGDPDPMNVLRWKELYHQLQVALEKCQALDHALDSIVLQNRG